MEVGVTLNIVLMITGYNCTLSLSLSLSLSVGLNLLPSLSGTGIGIHQHQQHPHSLTTDDSLQLVNSQLQAPSGSISQWPAGLLLLNRKCKIEKKYSNTRPIGAWWLIIATTLSLIAEVGL